MKHTLLAIDDVSLPMRKNVCLRLGRPEVRREPVLEPSPVESRAPDNRAAHFYGTVLHDRGMFRMWYYACHRGMNPDWPTRKMRQLAKNPSWLLNAEQGCETVQGPLCYAESDNGINWTKPALGQVLFKGSRENNALDLPHTVVSGAAVIRDDDDPELSRRYKMVYQFFPDQTDPVIPEFGTLPTIACAVSPDGLRWTVVAMPYINQFVEHCSFIKHDRRYIAHSQVFPGTEWSGAYTEGGAGGGRSGVAHATIDFDHWPDLWQWAFTLPEPMDPAKRGADNSYDQVHLGVGAASFGNVCVGVYGLWHSAAFGDTFSDISGDLGLLVSNDGVRFREPGSTPGRPYIHRDDSPATPVPGHNFNTILCQGNGILNVGDETRIYHGRWRNVGQKAADLANHYRAEVALAVISRDRWGALELNPRANDGEICSAPFMFQDNTQLYVNAEGVAGVSINLVDEEFRTIPGFTGGRISDPDGLECVVKWQGGSTKILSGKRVRVSVKLSGNDKVRPRVYALYLSNSPD
jgi:hypothetical protein